MTRSTVLTLALSALVASGISSAAQAQVTGAPTDTDPSMVVAAPATGTIAPSTLYGAGPPTDGLDKNPYREARQSRKTPAAGDKPPQSASTAGAKTRQPARSGTKPSGSSTLN
jgi:hypothetical protein